MLAVLAVVMLLYYKHSKKPVKRFLLGGGTGLISLLAIHQFTTGWITVNYFTLGVSVVLGVPGVITTIVLNQMAG